MSGGVVLLNPSGYPIDSDGLKRASQAALSRHCHHRDGSLSIVLTDCETVRELNFRYAKVQAPTDVLSFPAEPTAQECDCGGRYLGDIVIAFDYATVQAEKTAVPLVDVLCLLVIHGTLHLLGYDHNTRAARDNMWAAQEQALRAISIDPTVVDAYGNIDHD